MICDERVHIGKVAKVLAKKKGLVGLVGLFYFFILFFCDDGGNDDGQQEKKLRERVTMSQAYAKDATTEVDLKSKSR